MKKLLKYYGFHSDMQYYEMIVESVVNGQYTQSKEQFSKLPRENRKAFVKAIYGNWNSGLDQNDKKTFIDLI